MGFFLYLFEYNDDFECIVCVLIEVFSEKVVLFIKKVYMSMFDYFGSSNLNVYFNLMNKGNIEGKLFDINFSCELIRFV